MFISIHVTLPIATIKEMWSYVAFESLSQPLKMHCTYILYCNAPNLHIHELILYFSTCTCPQTHLLDCRFREVQCTQCGQLVPCNNLENHELNECPMRPSICQYCQRKVPVEQLEVCVCYYSCIC